MLGQDRLVRDAAVARRVDKEEVGGERVVEGAGEGVLRGESCREQERWSGDELAGQHERTAACRTSADVERGGEQHAR